MRLPSSERGKLERCSHFLEAMSAGNFDEILAARIARRGKAGLGSASAVAETGRTPEEVAHSLSTLVDRGTVLRAGDILIATERFRALMAEAVSLLEGFHQANPLVRGIAREALRDTLGVGPEIFSALIVRLVSERKLAITGEELHLAGRAVVMRDDESESKTIIENAFTTAGLKVPGLREVLSGLKLDKARAEKIVTLLLRDKVLVKVADDMVFHRKALDQLRRAVAAEKARSAKIDISRFKELTGVSRKYAIPLLEYLDRERVTRRVGNDRMIV